MGKSEIEAFLSHLATNLKVAASTQRLALNALVFLYKHVLDKPIGDQPTCSVVALANSKPRSPPEADAKWCGRGEL
jgi:hypothetical protein